MPQYGYCSADVLEAFWNRLPICNFLIDVYDSSFWPSDLLQNTSKKMKKNWNDMLDRTENPSSISGRRRIIIIVVIVTHL